MPLRCCGPEGEIPRLNAEVYLEMTTDKAARRTAALCVLLLFSLLAPSRDPLLAQSRTVSGTLRDSLNNETLPFATVQVIGTKIEAISNREGHFVLLDVPLAVVVLRISALGYKPAEVVVDVAAQSEPLEIALAGVPIELDEVAAIADVDRIMKAGEHVSQVAVSPAELVVLPNVGEVDIFRSIQLMPGIAGSNEQSAGLFVRGGTPDENLVLLDGMTVYHVDHFFGFFSAFNAEVVKDVQVYKSAYPAKYGGRTSGVIDLTGRSGDPEAPHVVAGINMLSVQGAGEYPLGGRGSIFFAVRRSYTDLVQTGLYNDIFGMLSGGAQPGAGFAPGGGPGGGPGGFANAQLNQTTPDFYFYDLNGKITYRPTNIDALALSVYNGQDNLDRSRDLSRDLQGPGGGAIPANLTGGLTDLTGWGNFGLSGKWSRQWSPRLFSNALLAGSIYYSDNDRRTQTEIRDLDADTLIRSVNIGSLEKNRIDDLGFMLDNEWQATQAHKVEFGLALKRLGVDFRFTRGDSTTLLDLDQQGFEGALYLQDTWKALPRLGLNFGARGVYYDNTNSLYLEPRLSASYSISDRVKLVGAYGQYHQFVKRVVNENVLEGSRDFWLLAEDEVGVSSAQHYVLGASYETAPLLFSAELYHKELQGLSEFTLRFRRDTGAEIENLFFEGSGYAQGLELLAQKKVGFYTGWISYTLSQVRHQFPGLNGGEEFPALHDQTHEVKLVGSVTGGRWTLSSNGLFATGRPYTAPESEYFLDLLDGSQQSYIHVGEKNALRLAYYSRFDASVLYRFNLGLWNGTIGASVFNVLDHTNVWYREFDLSATPPLVTDVTYLGRTLNLSVGIGI